MSVCALVDGQYGSTGKGLIAGHIAADYSVHVRVGAANAGHTVYTHFDRQPGSPHRHDPEGWEKHVLQSIPCAAYANPLADLVIGPGALISPEIFVRETVANHHWRQQRGLPEARVFVDPRAHVITQDQIDRESQSGLAERIGSTSTIAREGIGTAQADRVMRDAGCVQVGDPGVFERFFLPHVPIANARQPAGFMLKDVPEMLADRGPVLLEGTQGTGLSLTTGQFPYVTSRNVTSAGLAADSGVAPNEIDRVIMVLRTFPIRVAGPSGPFWHDSEEVTWEDIGVDPDRELTTVTKKVRRVATFSYEQARYSAILNGATEIALTFCDYIDPTIAGKSGTPDGLAHSHPAVWKRVAQIEDETGVPVRYLGTGPHSVLTRG